MLALVVQHAQGDLLEIVLQCNCRVFRQVCMNVLSGMVIVGCNSQTCGETADGIPRREATFRRGCRGRSAAVRAVAWDDGRDTPDSRFPVGRSGSHGRSVWDFPNRQRAGSQLIRLLKKRLGRTAAAAAGRKQKARPGLWN